MGVGEWDIGAVWEDVLSGGRHVRLLGGEEMPLIWAGMLMERCGRR